MIRTHAAAKVLSAALTATRVLDQSIHDVIPTSSGDEIMAYKRAVGGVLAPV